MFEGQVNKMKQIEFIGKKRMFKRVKMGRIMDLQDELQEEAKQAQEAAQEEGAEMKRSESLLGTGKLLEEILEPFEAKEMLDAEVDDFYLAQGMPMLFVYYKHNRSKEDIEKLKKQIIDNAVQMQLAGMSPASAQNFQQ